MAAGVTAAGCAATRGADTAGMVSVVATTTQVADFVRSVGGEKVAVTQVLKPNVDPHDFEASPADIVAIGRADLLVKNGVGLEKWLEQTVTAAGYSGPVVDASTGVSIRPGDAQEPAGDPHIWQDPRNAKIMVANIADGLAAADAADAGYFRERAAAYQSKLDALDAQIAAKIATIPAGQRKLVTNHDAFGYYIARYGLEFVGSVIPSFDTSAELSGRQIQDLVAKIKATGVKAIFSESSLPPKTAQTIAAEAGIRVEAGEDSLYADTLGPAGSAGATYLEAMTHNTDVIVAALRG
jgi:zinc/manganese transport system substrate-binding protein/manganese/iron transport system substrate-binding protein